MRGTISLFLVDASIRLSRKDGRSLEERPGSPFGRPDVVHRTILSVTDSPLFRRGIVDLHLHTRDGRVFAFSKEMRPPRMYNRFKGLFAQLLRKGFVGGDRRLIWELDCELRDALSGYDLVVLLDERGTRLDPLHILRELLRELKVAFLIGCFSRGSFSEEVKEAADLRISFSDFSLSASTTACMLLSYIYTTYYYERGYNA